MPDLTVSQGDHGFTWTFTVQTATGGAYNLTGKIATLKIWAQNNPNTLIVSSSTTVTDAAGGVCTYAPGSTDFLSIGKFRGEIECTEAGVADSVKSFTIDVIESP